MFVFIQLRTWLSSVASDDDERGASLVEYALLLALIAIVCMIALEALGTSTSGGIQSGADSFP
jgi:Flp pilus assembly pilin Flp